MSLPAGTTPIAFVFTADRALSRPFYRDVLGLPLLGEDDFAMAFDLGNGSLLRVTDMRGHTPSMHTVLGWRVADLDAAMTALADKGVRFERYEGMGQDEAGVWSMGTVRIAWFLDPEGNNLSLTQFE